MSAKLAPAMAMNSARIHCVSAENSAAEVGRVEKPPVGIVAKAYASDSYGVIRSSIPKTHSPESNSTSIAVSVDVDEPKPARGGADPFAERGDLGPGQLGVHELPASDTQARQDSDGENDDSHASEPLRELAPDAERLVDRVVVGDDARAGRREPGHPLEVRIERARELGSAFEQVGNGGEPGGDQPRQGDDEKPFADSDAARRVRRDTLQPEPEPARDDSRDDERVERLAVRERERDGKERRETEVLAEGSDEIGHAGQVDCEPPRAADPRDGLRQLTTPRRPTVRWLPP